MGWPITASDVRTELKWGPTDGDTVQLELYATAACGRIEAEIGHHSGQDIVAVARGPVASVVLDHVAASVTSVTVDTVALAATDWELSPTGRVVHGPFGTGRIVVTAVAPATVPKAVELAARYLAAMWFKQSKFKPNSGSGAGASSVPDQDVLQGFGLPRRVSEMIRPDQQVGGIG